ncbi:NTP transferase domain-containing protein [Billgrantia pellis]|uniref:NTP transferase domain-containing protein n=1 Tax=Billgrantia pellis TaxID=2606936 RepID=A0A7V7G102_9GAMM|nr:sugar phosphate nucleotidyltransferase [Halomonas pellis]KAA0012902.1 NTP transferase domain-containing protein [Halomonas pellis]
MMAVVLAGGRGTRLLPYTASFPKPLVPLGDMPVLEILLRQLATAGVTDVILAVNHLHHLIRAFCGDGRDFGLRIEYCCEDKPLGTAGPLGLLRDRLGENFIVVNGDLLTNFDIGALIDRHRENGNAASMAVYERCIEIEFGLVETNAEMHLTGYREKPRWSHLISMGLYLFQRDAVLPHLVPDTFLDMPDLMRTLLGDGVAVDCVRQDCLWLDIGRPADYAQAQILFETQRELFLGVQA